MLEIKGENCKDCKIFAETLEEETKSMVYKICDNPAFKDSKIRIMPDTHVGAGIVIGFTSPINECVNPDHVGCDIGCCIDTYILDKPVNPEEYALIEHRIRKEVKFGKELQDKASFEMKDFIKFMKSEYSRAKQQWPEMIEDFDISEEGLRKFTQRIGMDLGVFYKSLGSIGGGELI